MSAAGGSTVPVPSRKQGAGPMFERFVDIIAALRSEDGCPWDREQTHLSISRNMVEEAYEALDAIERDDRDDMVEELGDVLLEVVLQAQIGADEGRFAIDDVIEGISDKMVRRHPHVFGAEASLEAAGLTDEEVGQIESARTPGDVAFLWDFIKKKEKAAKRIARERRAAEVGEKLPAASILDGVPMSQPALMQAQDISRKAVACGFEWDSVDDVWSDFDEERSEYLEAVSRLDLAGETGDAEEVSRAQKEAELEFGDMLFALVNIARKDGLDAESALRATCAKFRRRWSAMEAMAVEEGRPIEDYGADGLNVLWDRAKEMR